MGGILELNWNRKLLSNVITQIETQARAILKIKVEHTTNLVRDSGNDQSERA